MEPFQIDGGDTLAPQLELQFPTLPNFQALEMAHCPFFHSE